MRSPTTPVNFLSIMLALSTLPFRFVTCTNHSEYVDESGDSIWYRVGEMTGLFLKTCLDLSANPNPGTEFLDVFQNCLRRKSLLILERTSRADVINIGSGIHFVKYRDLNVTQSTPYSTIPSSRHFVGDQKEWNEEVSRKLFNLFDSHEMKIDLNSDKSDLESRQPRGRRKKDNNMMVSLLVFSIIAVGMIVIPMGFQFLAVLGGKALLLAKLSLILSSIQGLKKIATSSFNYGLYSHSAPANPWDGEEMWNYPHFSSSGHSMANHYGHPYPQHDPYGHHDPYGQQDPYGHPNTNGYQDPQHDQMMYRRKYLKQKEELLNELKN